MQSTTDNSSTSVSNPPRQIRVPRSENGQQHFKQSLPAAPDRPLAGLSPVERSKTKEFQKALQSALGESIHEAIRERIENDWSPDRDLSTLDEQAPVEIYQKVGEQLLSELSTLSFPELVSHFTKLLAKSMKQQEGDHEGDEKETVFERLERIDRARRICLTANSFLSRLGGTILTHEKGEKKWRTDRQGESIDLMLCSLKEIQRGLNEQGGAFREAVLREYGKRLDEATDIPEELPFEPDVEEKKVQGAGGVSGKVLREKARAFSGATGRATRALVRFGAMSLSTITAFGVATLGAVASALRVVGSAIVWVSRKTGLSRVLSSLGQRLRMSAPRIGDGRLRVGLPFDVNIKIPLPNISNPFKRKSSPKNRDLDRSQGEMPFWDKIGISDAARRKIQTGAGAPLFDQSDMAFDLNFGGASLSFGDFSLGFSKKMLRGGKVRNPTSYFEEALHVTDPYVLTGADGSLTRLPAFLKSLGQKNTSLDAPRFQELFLKKIVPNAKTLKESELRMDDLTECQFRIPAGQTLSLPLASNFEVQSLTFMGKDKKPMKNEQGWEVREGVFGSLLVRAPSNAHYVLYRVKRRDEDQRIQRSTIKKFAKNLPIFSSYKDLRREMFQEALLELQSPALRAKIWVLQQQRRGFIYSMNPAVENYQKHTGDALLESIDGMRMGICDSFSYFLSAGVSRLGVPAIVASGPVFDSRRGGFTFNPGHSVTAALFPEGVEQYDLTQNSRPDTGVSRWNMKRRDFLKAFKELNDSETTNKDIYKRSVMLHHGLQGKETPAFFEEGNASGKVNGSSFLAFLDNMGRGKAPERHFGDILHHERELQGGEQAASLLAHKWTLQALFEEGRREGDLTRFFQYLDLGHEEEVRSYLLSEVPKRLRRAIESYRPKKHILRCISEILDETSSTLEMKNQGIDWFLDNLEINQQRGENISEEFSNEEILDFLDEKKLAHFSDEQFQLFSERLLSKPGSLGAFGASFRNGRFVPDISNNLRFSYNEQHSQILERILDELARRPASFLGKSQEILNYESMERIRCAHFAAALSLSSSNEEADAIRESHQKIFTKLNRVFGLNPAESITASLREFLVFSRSTDAFALTELFGRTKDERLQTLERIYGQDIDRKIKAEITHQLFQECDPSLDYSRLEALLDLLGLESNFAQEVSGKHKVVNAFADYLRTFKDQSEKTISNYPSASEFPGSYLLARLSDDEVSSFSRSALALERMGLLEIERLRDLWPKYDEGELTKKVASQLRVSGEGESLSFQLKGRQEPIHTLTAPMSLEDIPAVTLLPYSDRKMYRDFDAYFTNTLSRGSSAQSNDNVAFAQIRRAYPESWKVLEKQFGENSSFSAKASKVLGDIIFDDIPDIERYHAYIWLSLALAQFEERDRKKDKLIPAARALLESDIQSEGVEVGSSLHALGFEELSKQAESAVPESSTKAKRAAILLAGLLDQQELANGTGTASQAVYTLPILRDFGEGGGDGGKRNVAELWKYMARDGSSEVPLAEAIEQASSLVDTAFAKVSRSFKSPYTRYLQRDGAPIVVKGSPGEFKEFTSYEPGNDPRRIDWKASARRDRLLVQERVEREIRPVTLVVDIEWLYENESTGKVEKTIDEKKLKTLCLHLLLAEREGQDIRLQVFGRRKVESFEKLFPRHSVKDKKLQDDLRRSLGVLQDLQARELPVYGADGNRPGYNLFYEGSLDVPRDGLMVCAIAKKNLNASRGALEALEASGRHLHLLR